MKRRTRRKRSGSPVLRDASLYQWLFYLRWCSRDNEEQRRQNAENFHRVLQDAFGWAGENPDACPAPRSASPQASAYSERIASVEWREHNGVLRELESRTLLDTFYLQLGQAFEGDAEPKTFAKPTLWRPSQQPDNFLGEALCLCAEVQEGLSEAELHALCAEIAPHRPCAAAGTDAPINGVLLPIGYLATVPDETRETFILLYHNTAGERAARFLHAILPQLILSLLKRRGVAQQYEPLIAQAHRQEQEIDSLLKQSAEPRLKLEQLETLSARISDQQMHFIETISTLEELLQTLRISLRNLQLLFDDPLWGGCSAEAERLFASELQLLIEQLEADLRYLQITREQADRALQSLLTIASIRSTHWERRIALVATAFVVISVADLFGDVLTWQVRLAMLGFTLPLFLLLYLWLRRR